MAKKYTQLNELDRNTIEYMLNKRETLSSIASTLGRDISGLRREIQRNRSQWSKANKGSYLNDCAFSESCRKRHVCRSCTFKGRPCRGCSSCNSNCIDFQLFHCPQLSKAPYVCNGCITRLTCKRSKIIYISSVAQRLSDSLRRSSREGHGYTQHELQRLESILVPLVKQQSQSINHAYQNNKDQFPMSQRHLYTLIDNGVLSVRNIDLPLKVRFKPRKQSVERKVDTQCRQGRNYQDFNSFLYNHPGIPVVEMDSVEGRKGESVLLTLYFRNSSVQLFFKREANTSHSVIETFNHLYDLLGHDDFTSMFPCILTDNGSEFSNPTAIENHIITDEHGVVQQMIPRTKVFYCDPKSPEQKAVCERNHEFIRRFIPKGVSFNSLTQDKILLMSNHINSYKRPKIKMESPLSIFISHYGKKVALALGLSEIKPNDIFLNASILK